MRIAVCLAIAASLFNTLGPVFAEDLPKIDFAATCRSASDSKATVESCLADEERARSQLGQHWGQYPPAEANHCSQLASMKAIQSYVELLTCLEMALDAKKLPRDITQE
jgi:hypothetical protein